MSIVAGIFFCKKNIVKKHFEDKKTSKETIGQFHGIDGHADEKKNEFERKITRMYDDLSKRLHLHDKQFRHLNTKLAELRRNSEEL